MKQKQFHFGAYCTANDVFVKRLSLLVYHVII